MEASPVASDQLEYAEMTEPFIGRLIWVRTDQKEAWLRKLNEIPSVSASPAHRIWTSTRGEVTADLTVIMVALDPNLPGHVISAGIRIKEAVESVGMEVAFC